MSVARWLLLIYSVPAEPSRKRAFIWREVKTIGAAALRDGTYVLPDRAGTRAAAEAIATRVREYGGRATLAYGACLETLRAAEVVTQFRADRDEEYAEIRRAAEGLLQHVARETEHRDFTFLELQPLEHDLAKLRRWLDLVRARDYFDAPGAAHVDAALARCEEALGSFTEAAAEQEAVTA